MKELLHYSCNHNMMKKNRRNYYTTHINNTYLENTKTLACLEAQALKFKKQQTTCVRS